MAADPLSLTSLVEAVVDGLPLDAAAAEHMPPEERRLVDHLRLVAAVAQVHRTIAEDDGAYAPGQSGGAAEPPRRWGNLELIERVGEGAYGEVWRARDIFLDSEVALKLLRRHSGQTDVTFRVLQEGRALARLRHPNVVTVYGVEAQENEVGLRMEFVRGKTLAECLRLQGVYSASEAALIAQDLCRALAAVHRAGLVHRDVKAQNVMREEGGRVVLMDLGSGRLQAEAVGSRLAGTPLYLAPEVLAGADATPRSDIYSLGVLLFHLVTGDYPVRAESLDGLRRAQAAAARSLYDLRPDLPEPFVRAVDRALARRPEDRFATPGEMAAALGETEASKTSPTAVSSAVPLAGSERSRASHGAIAMAAVVMLALAATAGDRSGGGTSRVVPGTQLKRVAVLPFSTIDADQQLEQLAQGIAMELTTSLGQIGALKVVPWTFMKRLETPWTVREVGDRTEADGIVEGTIQRSERLSDGISLKVQVYQAGTGALLWTHTFEERIGGLLQLQADIAKRIATRFTILLARREEMLLSRFRYIPPEAVELYLKGRQAADEYSENFEPAIGYFRKAIEIYPEFADAYAQLADCYALQASFSGSVTATAAFPRALEASNAAIALNPELPEAYATRAFAKALLAWDWTGAAADYERALALDPHSADVRSSYSNYLSMIGRHDEAVEQSRIAEARAPLSPVISRRVAWALFMGRHYDDAIRQLQSVLGVEPAYGPARNLLARALAMAGRYDEALQAIEPVERGFEAISAQVYGLAGRREEALELLRRATASGAVGNPPYQIAAAYAAVGERDRALMWLERALDTRDPSLVNIAFDPRLDPLRGDLRFDALVRRTNLLSR